MRITLGLLTDFLQSDGFNGAAVVPVVPPTDCPVVPPTDGPAVVVAVSVSRFLLHLPLEASHPQAAAPSAVLCSHASRLIATRQHRDEPTRSQLEVAPAADTSVVLAQSVHLSGSQMLSIRYVLLHDLAFDEEEDGGRRRKDTEQEEEEDDGKEGEGRREDSAEDGRRRAERGSSIAMAATGTMRLALLHF
eukprot:CAMPEP_0197449340 /NCGR_PEP_ID=MMETSP1175-20131217/21090_1 /TAXON_ID=1003142 /ORGANISM="Triceratium dubium, Strain CCMP147" /LENGTH=190 /DNA_ID=CAMNT_0042981441 /DNA_START=231 /DNA_END=803 /DNA_ORIENTATION=-